MKPHISNLKIEAFRGLKGIELKKLGQFSLLVGFNNSGKSSILEAIEYFCKPMDPIALINLSRRREVSIHQIDPIASIKWLFPAIKDPVGTLVHPNRIAIEGELTDCTREVSAEYREHEVDVYQGPPISQSDIYSDSVPTTTTPPPEAYSRREGIGLNLHFKDVVKGTQSPKAFVSKAYDLIQGVPFVLREHQLGPSIPFSSVTPITHRVQDIQKRNLSESILRYFKAEVVQVVRAFDKNIISLLFIDKSGLSELWVEHSELGMMPLSAFGDGVRRVLAIATALVMARGGILLIDEMETAIHKDALREVFKWLREASDRMQVQVIATSHSLEAIDAMLLAEKDAIDEVVAYRLPRRGSKERFVRYSGEELKDLRVIGGMEVR